MDRADGTAPTFSDESLRELLKGLHEAVPFLDEAQHLLHDEASGTGDIDSKGWSKVFTKREQVRFGVHLLRGQHGMYLPQSVCVDVMCYMMSAGRGQQRGQERPH